MKYLIFLMLIIPCLTFSGCQKEETKNISSLEAQDLTNLNYGTHPSQTVDIYLPKNRNSETKTIILVHGGSWLAGDKGELRDLALTFRNKGYATASVNYRLSHTAENHVFPAALDDLDNAIKFVSNKSQEWNVSDNLYSLMGLSAGGHLALLYTYTRNTDNKIKTVISIAGPTDLLSLYNTSSQHAQVVKWFVGQTPQENTAIYKEVSPISFVKNSSKPTLLFHGKQDLVVPYQQSLSLKVKLDEFDVKNKLVTYTNLGHEADVKVVPGFVSECEAWLAENLK
ncbi:MAG: alpha/beta hydrolase [Flavobacterium sp.]|nr:alpha/beta hydrolase [Pedobacter sp.]